jgi:hypothetical protein
MDLGPPISYVALQEDTPVFDRSGRRIGVVEQVVGDLRADVFDGLLIHTLPLPGHHRYAVVDQIDGLHEHGVTLRATADELTEPPAYVDVARARRDGSDEARDLPWQARLRRAWDRVVGHD